ncbi:hypothetical protein LXA43DRAFT_1097984 [Ganoderma leucocontextum]|nr:hypothetical protein LXA43DRAFT_1097984 [Ganoderma leucocontextum]
MDVDPGYLDVVHVSDSPDDIICLLLVLLDLLRQKDVLDDALSRLKKYYTHDLSAWQDPDARAQYVTTSDLNDAPTVVQLAHLTNTPLLLPAAYLVCVRLGTKCWVADDGSVVKSPISSLSILEQALLIHVKGSLTQACATRALHLLAAVPCASCTSRGNCMAAREASLDALRNKGYGYLRVPFVSDQNAFKPIAGELWNNNNWSRFCGSCREALVKADDSSLDALWKNVPHIFNVDIDMDSWRSGCLAGTGQ